MRNAIITGSSGQDGHYLAELLRTQKVDPVLVNRRSGIDLSSAESVAELVESVKPDFIFHLAASSTTEHFWGMENHQAIAAGSMNILEAVRKHMPDCRVFLAGSAYQFQNIWVPIKETDPWETRSVYCAARGYSNLLARAYRHMGLHVYFGYFFHHESPRRHPRHLSQQIAYAALHAVPIEIGDLNMVKEWTHAADTMEAIWTFVNQNNVWEANIGTGIGRSVAEFAEACFQAVGLNYLDYVRPKPGFVSEYSRITCDPERIFSTGWRPYHDLTYLAEQMVNT